MFYEDSITLAVTLIAMGTLGFLWSLERPRKWAESIMWLVMAVSASLPSMGYDLRVSFAFLNEFAAVVAVLLILFALFRYGRRELAEGEYDQVPADLETGSRLD